MTRSLNKVILIGNLTRDPEVRYTPGGVARAVFGLATNRNWTTESGEKKEEVEFHNIVVWNKLAELCSQYLSKGRKVYVEGRLQTRKWTTPENEEKRIVEIVVSDILFLDPKGADGGQAGDAYSTSSEVSQEASSVDTFDPNEVDAQVEAKKVDKTTKKTKKTDEVADDDIPF